MSLELQEDLDDYGKPLASASLEDVELAVKHGMYWLDENVYGWVEAINLDMFELESGRSCVLGQQWEANNDYSSGSNYINFIEEAHPNLTHGERAEWAERNKFYVADGSGSQWSKLTSIWKDKIRERLAK